MLSEVGEEIHCMREAYDDSAAAAVVNQISSTSEVCERKQKLTSMLTIGNAALQKLLLDHHHLFSVEEEERG